MDEEHEYAASIAEAAARAVERHTKDPHHNWIEAFRRDAAKEKRPRMHLHASLRTAAELFWGEGKKELSNELSVLLTNLGMWPGTRHKR